MSVLTRAKTWKPQAQNLADPQVRATVSHQLGQQEQAFAAGILPQAPDQFAGLGVKFRAIIPNVNGSWGCTVIDSPATCVSDTGAEDDVRPLSAPVFERQAAAYLDACAALVGTYPDLTVEVMVCTTHWAAKPLPPLAGSVHDDVRSAGGQRVRLPPVGDYDEAFSVVPQVPSSSARARPR